MPPRLDMGADPYGLLLKQRIVFLGGEVNDFSADATISQLLMLDAANPGRDIKFFINSPGGSVTAGMGIYDTMMLCRSKIQTYCFGIAASMGAFLLGAGTRGYRFSMPNSRIMIHQPLGGAQGTAADVEIQTKEIMFHKANLNRIMAAYTGQRLDQIERDTDRDKYMSPVEAQEYGLIDHIIGGEQATFQVEADLSRMLPRPARYAERIPDVPDIGEDGAPEPAAPRSREEAVKQQKRKEIEYNPKTDHGFRFKGKPAKKELTPAQEEQLAKAREEVQEMQKLIDPIMKRRLAYEEQKEKELKERQEELNREALEAMKGMEDFTEAPLIHDQENWKESIQPKRQLT